MGFFHTIMYMIGQCRGRTPVSRLCEVWRLMSATRILSALHVAAMRRILEFIIYLAAVLWRCVVDRNGGCGMSEYRIVVTRRGGGDWRATKGGRLVVKQSQQDWLGVSVRSSHVSLRREIVGA